MRLQIVEIGFFSPSMRFYRIGIKQPQWYKKNGFMIFGLESYHSIATGTSVFRRWIDLQPNHCNYIVRKTMIYYMSLMLVRRRKILLNSASCGQYFRCIRVTDSSEVRWWCGGTAQSIQCI
jgi:hypothetical protein